MTWHIMITTMMNIISNKVNNKIFPSTQPKPLII